MPKPLSVIYLRRLTNGRLGHTLQPGGLSGLLLPLQGLRTLSLTVREPGAVGRDFLALGRLTGLSSLSLDLQLRCEKQFLRHDADHVMHPHTCNQAAAMVEMPTLAVPSTSSAGHSMHLLMTHYAGVSGLACGFCTLLLYCPGKILHADDVSTTKMQVHGPPLLACFTCCHDLALKIAKYNCTSSDPSCA